MVHTCSDGLEDAKPSGDANPLPPPTMEEVLAQLVRHQHTMVEILRIITQNTAPGCRNPQPQEQNSSYREFLDTQPPVFTQAKEPLEADEWLNTIEQKFHLLRCTDQQKAEFAANQLHGAAGIWWVNHLRTLPEDTRLTWNQFKAAFRSHHIPASLMKIKLIEFLELTQGTKTLIEYMHAFNHLSRYAPDLVDTEEKRMDFFMRGLSTKLQVGLALAKCATYNELVSDAITLENKIRLHKEDKKRKKSASGSSSQQPHRVQVVQRVHYGPPSGQHRPPQQQQKTQSQQSYIVALPKNCEGGSKAPCYNCHQAGHFARECSYPRRSDQ